MLAKRAALQDALAKANATVDDLHGVEIIGGGVRVPKIQEMLRDFSPLADEQVGPAELGLHLNGDGAAFHGANVSTSSCARSACSTTRSTRSACA